MEVQATSVNSKFARFAWATLGFNLLVILWGVFLRASKSGDGCGQHWLTCGGEVIPSAPQLKTVIEFSHRVTSGLALIAVVVLVVWAFRAFPKKHILRKTAFASLLFIIFEALLGAGLVLTGNTAEALTPARPFWMAGHLINTFALVALLSLTAWLASSGRAFNFNVPRKTLVLLIVGVLGVFLVGMSGSTAALSSMLFPSTTLAEGFAQDFSDTSYFLLRLRISHPILSIALGIYMYLLSLWAIKRAPESPGVKLWGNRLALIVVVQLLAGGLTLVMLAPIVMQLVHLLLADLLWIAFILMAAELLAVPGGNYLPPRHEEHKENN
jgi:heme A synthase